MGIRLYGYTMCAFYAYIILRLKVSILSVQHPKNGKCLKKKKKGRKLVIEVRCLSSQETDE